MLIFQDAKRPFAATVAAQQPNRLTSEANYGIVAIPDDYQVRTIQLCMTIFDLIKI